MEFITFSEALKLIKDGYKIWHISWFPSHLLEYPNASHFIVYPGKDWQLKSSHFALIECTIDNQIAEKRWEILQRKKDGHPTYIKELSLEVLLDLKKQEDKNKDDLCL